MNSDLKYWLWGCVTGVILGYVLFSTPCHSAELIVEAGPGADQAAAVRVAGSFKVFSWLNVETGILGTQGGVIGDVTPMLHYGGKFYVEGGIGLSLASGSNLGGREQSTTVNFRDVACLGYHIDDKTRVGLCAEHYSNGGKYNPVFGSDKNSGYTWGMLRVGRTF